MSLLFVESPRVAEGCARSFSDDRRPFDALPYLKREEFENVYEPAVYSPTPTNPLSPHKLACVLMVLVLDCYFDLDLEETETNKKRSESQRLHAGHASCPAEPRVEALLSTLPVLPNDRIVLFQIQVEIAVETRTMRTQNSFWVGSQWYNSMIKREEFENVYEPAVYSPTPTARSFSDDRRPFDALPYPTRDAVRHSRPDGQLANPCVMV
jgi:hypothetical protein